MIEETEYMWGYVIFDQDGNWNSDTIHVYQSHEGDREVWVSFVSTQPPEIMIMNWNDPLTKIVCVGKVSYWKRNIKKENNIVTFH